jgi:cytochrome P450
MEKRGISPKDKMHYGFGLGPRICPGKHLGQLEVSLLVGAIVKTFKFKAINEENKPRAGVSTKPADGTLVELELRNP